MMMITESTGGTQMMKLMLGFMMGMVILMVEIEFWEVLSLYREDIEAYIKDDSR